ncbi:hypothetical protein DEE41_39750, partial [Burkholderia cepacia]|nr:hypothetical protein [Burkholderia cepacia]
TIGWGRRYATRSDARLDSRQIRRKTLSAQTRKYRRFAMPVYAVASSAKLGREARAIFGSRG